uniref:CARD domain-containing protein n=1 Tax=Plectus sambesii TaxID=2011161 RepID=A0A914WW41_9BILA
MQVASVVDYLIGTEPPVLLSSHENEIMKITDSEERNRKFLTILQQRVGVNAFEQFLEALKYTQQYDVRNTIFDRSKEQINLKYSDKNQDDNGAAFVRATKTTLPSGAKTDDTLQNQAPSTSSTIPSQPNNDVWQQKLET